MFFKRFFMFFEKRVGICNIPGIEMDHGLFGGNGADIPDIAIEYIMHIIIIIVEHFKLGIFLYKINYITYPFFIEELCYFINVLFYNFVNRI